MPTADQIIEKTKKWIDDVVIACHFCPFAAQVVKLEQVHYEVENNMVSERYVDVVLHELSRLDHDNTIETSFLIFPHLFAQFDDFLNLVSFAECLIKQYGYGGIYQLASFHPLYVFANSDEDDAANYTNRSVYPMLHFLREASIDKVLEHYKSPENIPVANIDFARKKGLTPMKILRDLCL